jgi:CTP:molybdopterin cytidylyltransferase MocA
VIAAVVLAAGAATRYGSAKQLVYLPAVLERLAATPVDEVVVVEGAYPLEELGLDVRVVRCAEWERGPGASLRCGLAALGPEIEAALVVLADGPTLDPLAVERVLAHRDDAVVVAASYDGTRDHPALVARAAWESIPDEGARALEAALVPCDDLEPPGDMDYPPAPER